MCLQSDASSGSDNTDSMEAIRRTDDKHRPKDCSVVLVPLDGDIARRKTVKVFSMGHYVLARRESSNWDFVVIDAGVEKNGGKLNDPSLPISVYSTVNNCIVTEVRCEDFRKRKCHLAAQAEAEEDRVVADVVDNLIDTVAAEPVPTESIDFSSPGPKEIGLVRDFCRENGYEWRDYRDVESLFTFRTLPSLEAETMVEPANRRPKVGRKKTADKRDRVKTAKSRTDQVTKSCWSNVGASGLEKIDNLKIRKILEDFGRLSKSEENIRAPKRKKIRIDSNSANKNLSLKPLNLCKKDNREAEKPVTISKSVQSDISISGSILRTLLHHRENSKEDGDKEWRENSRQRRASAENYQKKTSKKSTAQQTDGEDEISEKTPSQTNGNDRWLNDPTAILKKIHKLKKDILYLDLLAEEKEKERIAILCFRNYKESILRKIFANGASQDVSRAQNRAVDVPKLIHPSAQHRPLTSVLFPSNDSVAEGRDSYATLPDHPQVPLNQIDDNFLRFGNCVKCDLAKSAFLNPSYRNPWYCHPLCQTHSCSQHEKECGGFVVDPSTK
ncbi:uncharacterized protein LOC111619017 [Centruroides sculpturatus]|uniref:uncharacterized protein LOC111619017 n=1 Tax=Centruroides sculpturatus TaxID=218467 RepID=UPI000C6C9255|nr:uncharacterized protein LOC111619017 [Centruroides sculpturatus]XP_023216416.1 uncharacterized protein LOC111619017 [Centruroides sculpturatus]